MQFQGRHLVARHHAVADALVGQAKHVLHKLGLILVENAGLLGVLDQQHQLLDRMDHLLAGDRLEAEAAQDEVGQAVHQQNHRPGDDGEDQSAAGPASRAARSGICSAIVFGINSPKTTCRNVMRMKATGAAMVWAMTWISSPVSQTKPR